MGASMGTMAKTRRSFALAAALGMVACQSKAGPGSEETAGDETASEEAGSGSTSSRPGLTDGGPEVTTAPDTDGVSACALYCERIGSCTPEGEPPPLSECIEDCVEFTSNSSPACAAAYEAVLSCYAGLEDCEAFYDEDNPACREWIDAIDASCEDETCTVSIGGDSRDVCELAEQCGDTTRTVLCNDTERACTCIENGERVGACSTEGICHDLALLDEQFATCCGWAE